jgi:FKBP-type peptidyl-prolyl cis-trans isomerase
MAKVHQRVFALVAAVLFLVSSIGFSGYVIWEMRKKPSTDNASENALSETPNEEGESLKGTKLENYQPVTSVESLQIIDIKEGTGDAVKEGATVTGHYTGALAKDGTIFESSKDGGEPVTFPLGNVIEGWQKGVPGMKVGGIRRLVIPAAQAYGEQGSPPTIGPNEPLVFDIELTAVQ